VHRARCFSLPHSASLQASFPFLPELTGWYLLALRARWKDTVRCIWVLSYVAWRRASLHRDFGMPLACVEVCTHPGSMRFRHSTIELWHVASDKRGKPVRSTSHSVSLLEGSVEVCPPSVRLQNLDALAMSLNVCP